MIFQTSSLTFGQAKVQVAEAAGKQQTPEFRDRAGRAIQWAIRQWNKENWKWTTQECTFPVLPNVAQYQVPYDFRDVYTLRLEGLFDRVVTQKPRRDFDRRTWKQVPSFPVAYNMLWTEPQGKLELMPYPISNETGHLRYYARMTIPCDAQAVVTGNWVEGVDPFLTYTYTLTVDNSSTITIGSPYSCLSSQKQSDSTTQASTGFVTAILSTTQILVTSNNAHATPLMNGTLVVGGDGQFLDTPDTYGDDILALATWKFLIGVGAAPERISTWQTLAAKGFADAMAAENDPEDDDIAFEAPTYEPGHFLAPFIVAER